MIPISPFQCGEAHGEMANLQKVNLPTSKLKDKITKKPQLIFLAN
jgi:hypothetical protein